jgi:hypothetical protein
MKISFYIPSHCSPAVGGWSSSVRQKPVSSSGSSWPDRRSSCARGNHWPSSWSGGSHWLSSWSGGSHWPSSWSGGSHWLWGCASNSGIVPWQERFKILGLAVVVDLRRSAGAGEGYRPEPLAMSLPPLFQNQPIKIIYLVMMQQSCGKIIRGQL